MSLYLFNYAYKCMFVSALSDPTSNSERSAIGGNKQILQILYCIVTNYMKNSFSYSGATLWNSLHRNIRESSSIDQFKRLLYQNF